MALFERNSPLKPVQAYLKMGIYGNAGTGKTFTASKVAIGLAEYVKAKTGALPPVFFLDTETGSTWAKAWFDAAGIEFVPICTRAFSDLKQAVLDAEREQAILITDSITHFWIELCLTFARQRKRKDNKLEFQDYGAIKPMWAAFTELYLNSKAHIILCGRAGNTYEYQEKEEGGKKELISTGTKMKAESEMGYEPSLLVEMIAEKSMERKKKLTIRKGYVVKDRSTLLDGREFINPTFKVFLPHIDLLNIGGAHVGIATARNSAALFDKNTGRPDWQHQKLQKEIVLEEIENLLVLHVPGQAAAEKQRKVKLIRDHFNATWKELEEVLSVEQVRQGYDTMHRELEGVPSRYSRAEETMDDEIPDFGARKAAREEAATGQEVSQQAGNSSPPAQEIAPQESKSTLPTFDINKHNINTPEGTKAAAAEFIKILGYNQLEDRPGVFLGSSGVMLVEAMRAHGLGLDVKKIETLGISLPQADPEEKPAPRKLFQKAQEGAAA